jgi:hypothetical protein
MKSSTLYVPIHAGIFTNRKTERLAGRLGLPVPTVVGHLASLWCTALEQSTGGVLRKWDAIDVARAARWSGKPTDLLDALIAEEWLDVAAEDLVDDGIVVVVAGTLCIRSWDDYAGAGIAAREKERKRKADIRKHRASSSADTADLSADNTPLSAPPSADNATLSADVPSQLSEAKRNEAKRNEAELSESAAPKPALPPPSAVEPEDQAETQQERAEARYAKRVAGQAYEQHNSKKAAAEAIYGRPQTPRDLLLLEVDGEPLATTWGKRFRALDGKAGRPTLTEVVTNLWKYAEAKSWGINGTTVLAWWATQLAKDNDKFRRAWERDGGTTAVSSDPLWPVWRKLKDDPTKDPGPFEEWKLKREELGVRSGSPKPSGGQQGQPATQPRQDQQAPETEPDPATVEEARTKLAALSAGLLAKPKRPLTAGRAVLDRLLPPALTTDGDSR